MASDPHKKLRDDVRLLGELLGEALRRDEGMPHYERVERVRALAKRTRSSRAGDMRLANAMAASVSRRENKVVHPARIVASAVFTANFQS